MRDRAADINWRITTDVTKRPAAANESRNDTTLLSEDTPIMLSVKKKMLMGGRGSRRAAATERIPARHEPRPPGGPEKNAGRAWDTAGIARKWEGERRVRHLSVIHANHTKGCVLPDQIDVRFNWGERQMMKRFFLW